NFKQTVFAYLARRFHKPYQKNLLQFSCQGFLTGQEYILHQLHGDGTSSALELLLLEVCGDRKLESFLLKSIVTIEIWVFRIADRKSTRLNSSHVKISYAVFCLKKKK